MLIIVGAIIDFMIGAILGPSSNDLVSKGFPGFSTEVFAGNLKSDYRSYEGVSQNFFTVFAIFFPSVTGIQAGANISGDLKDPGKSIPKGTLLALCISMLTYTSFVFFIGGAAMRDGSGNATDLIGQSLPYEFACTANHVRLIRCFIDPIIQDFLFLRHAITVCTTVSQSCS